MASTATTDHAHLAQNKEAGEIPNASNAYQAGNGSGYGSPNANGAQQRPAWDYNGNPLAHAHTGESARFPPFAGYLQPGLYKPPTKNFGNPAPLGLSAFALTTFILSLLNFHTRNLATPSIVIGPAFAYGGLVQLLAGMWHVISTHVCLARSFVDF